MNNSILEMAQPLGETWYCGFRLFKEDPAKEYLLNSDPAKQYLLNLDTMKLVKITSTERRELWGLQGLAEWMLQEGGKFAMLHGPFAIIWEQEEKQACNFTCHVKMLPRPAADT